MSPADVEAAVARVRSFYERLTPADLDRLPEIYAANAYFRDPFNEVRGAAAIRTIFEHMFAQLGDCRFEILETLADRHGAMLVWNMTFRFRRLRPDTVQIVHGASHLKFDAGGRIAYHRDYWDAADELYAKLPLIGALMRYLRRRMA